VKKKNDINGQKLERLNSDLFRSFDPEDEPWIGGGSKTVTGGPTGTPDSPDAWLDMDWFPVETPPQT
jgi:hypothetical protein